MKKCHTNDKNGNQLATVNRYEIPSEKKDSTYVDIDVTLGDNRLNENMVNHYNALNQLTQTLTKNYKVSFTYDAEGLRTSKTVNGEKTVFVWDGDQLVMELSESGRVQKRYIRGNDLVYADKGTGTKKQFYVTDPHGNVVQLTDESGKVVKTYEYDSFGNEVKPDSKDDNPFRYCGEYYDKETGEIYLRARYYRPSVGRFLTRDTYMGEEDDVLSLHLYIYCGNDGVNSVDPSGHWKKKVHSGMTKVVAKAIGFSAQEARIIGIASNEADHPHKNSNWKVEIITGTTITLDDLIDVGKFTSKSPKSKGKTKVKLHGPSKKEYEEGVTKKFIKGKVNVVKKNRNKTLAVVGMWLHQLQDRWSHGLSGGRKHIKKRTDNYLYDYRKGKYVKVKWTKISEKINSNRRVYNTVEVTAQYLLNAKSVIGTTNKTNEGKKKKNDKILLAEATRKGMYYLWGIKVLRARSEVIQ